MSTIEKGKSREKVYIAGPMTGIKGFNYPAFEIAEYVIRKAGFEPVNPAGQVEGWTHKDYMRRGFKRLMECDRIALLPGWPASSGANAEFEVAVQLGMPAHTVAYYEKDYLDE